MPYLRGYKTIQLVKRRKDLTHEQFKNYWLTEHNKKIEQRLINIGLRRELAASFAEGVVINGEVAPGIEPPFDGMLEMFFEHDSAEDVKASWTQELVEFLPKLFEDEKNFCDPEKRAIILIEEWVMAERKTK